MPTSRGSTVVRRAAADFRPADVRVARAGPQPRAGRAPARRALARATRRWREAYGERLHEERRDGHSSPSSCPTGRITGMSCSATRSGSSRAATARSCAAARPCCPTTSTLCATAWMHGVFAAQLTIGNTSFHKLFSVSRDPYNITRASGLRILAEIGRGLAAARRALRLRDGAQRLPLDLPPRRPRHHRPRHCLGRATPPCNGLSTSRASRAGSSSSAIWCSASASWTMRAASRSTRERKRFSFRPDPDWLWGQRYPDAVYHLVTSTPDAIEAVGGDELLYADGVAARRRLCCDAHAADGRLQLRRRRLDDGCRRGRAPGGEVRGRRRRPTRCWRRRRAGGRTCPRDLRLGGRRVPMLAALETVFPWLAHNAMMHLTVPHGLEQYSGAAWGTRDVCQGPIEFLLALEHDEPVRDILRIVFAEQNETQGDWPQWFMLEPYSNIRDRHAHGDVIVWPLKALCDYLEATNDLAFLDEPVAWRRDGDFARTERRDADRRACREAPRHRAGALHPGHAPHPLRRGRLERQPAAGRPGDARLDGEQLDGRAPLPAAQALRRGDAPRGAGERAAELDGLPLRWPRISTAIWCATASSPAMRSSRREGRSPSSCFTRATGARASAIRCCR